MDNEGNIYDLQGDFIGNYNNMVGEEEQEDEQ